MVNKKISLVLMVICVVALLWSVNAMIVAATTDPVEVVERQAVITDEQWVIGCFMNSKNSKADQRIPKAICDIAPLYKLDPLWVAAIIYKESTFRINCTGAAGERGLMQVHPCHRKRVDWSKMYEIEPNIHAGCAEFVRHLASAKGSLSGATRLYTGGVSHRYDSTYRTLCVMLKDYQERNK